MKKNLTQILIAFFLLLEPANLLAQTDDYRDKSSIDEAFKLELDALGLSLIHI